MSDIVCDTCGYPDWWVDNDCADCGGMTFDTALDNHSQLG